MVNPVANPTGSSLTANKTESDVFRQLETGGTAPKKVDGSKGSARRAIKSITIVPDSRPQLPRGSTANGTMRVVGGNDRGVDPGMTRANLNLPRSMPKFTPVEQQFRPFGSPNFKVKVEYQPNTPATALPAQVPSADNNVRRAVTSSEATAALAGKNQTGPLTQTTTLAGRPAMGNKLPEGFEFNKDTGVLYIGGELGRALGAHTEQAKSYWENSASGKSSPYELELKYFVPVSSSASTQTASIGSVDPGPKKNVIGAPVAFKQVAALRDLMRSGLVKTATFEGSNLKVPVVPDLGGKQLGVDGNSAW